MLTAILLAHDPPGQMLRREAVMRSLSSLVEACVQGLVGDAVLIGAASRGLDRIADDAGCALVETPSPDDGLRQALARARSERLFLLQAGYAIERGFIDELHDALAYGAPAAPFVLRAAPQSLVTRLAPSLAPAVGLVATKASLSGAASADLAHLARRLRVAELVTRARKAI